MHTSRSSSYALWWHVAQQVEEGLLSWQGHSQWKTMDSVYFSPSNFLSPTIKKCHFSSFCGWLACDLPWFVFVWSLSPLWLFSTPWTVARQALLSMGLPRQECCHFLLHCHDWRPWIAILCWSWINPFHAVEVTGRLFILGQRDDYFFT